MRGVVVDFYTLYDPVALSGAVLSYLPTYKTLYASKRSFWLEAHPLGGSGWVPISGFRQLDNGLDHWGVKWLREWCKNSLNLPEDSISRDNLYASILMIQRLLDAGLLRLVPLEDAFIQFGEKVMRDKDMLSTVTFDSMMPFGKGKSNSFHLSPDLGNGFRLGTAVILNAKDELRFSTSNALIKSALEQILPIAISNRHPALTEEQMDVYVPCKGTLTVEGVFRLLEDDRFLGDTKRFLSKIEQCEKDWLYFATQMSLGDSSGAIALKGKISAEIWKFND
jgi:hypothetical protein